MVVVRRINVGYSTHQPDLLWLTIVGSGLLESASRTRLDSVKPSARGTYR
jgi:hypothetical protein